QPSTSWSPLPTAWPSASGRTAGTPAWSPGHSSPRRCPDLGQVLLMTVLPIPSLWMAPSSVVLGQSRPFPDWEWIRRNGDTLVEQGVEHVQLTVMAVAIGFLIAFPLAIL